MSTTIDLSKFYTPTERQRVFHSCPADIALYGGAAGGGKALAVDTPIPTPTGWTTMGELKPGDYVFDENGKPCLVLACSPIMEGRECFEVEFSDGSVIVADKDHLWHTFTASERLAMTRRTPEYRQRRRESRPSRGKGKRPDLCVMNSQREYELLNPPTGGLRTTFEIMQTLLAGRKKNHSVNVAGALSLPRKELPLDPYVLGLWLGDGNSYYGSICTTDEEILAFIREAGFELSPYSDSKSYGVLGLQPLLRSLGVLGNKHIPQEYLRASEEQRLALLQGLMDSDGCVCENGQCEITTTYPQLRDGIFELILSLGIKVSQQEGRAKLNGNDYGPKWRFKFVTDKPVFRLTRKRIKQKTDGFRGTHLRRYIVDVRPVESVPVRCIKVSSPTGMFLAGRTFIPTHNSEALLWEAFMYCLETPGDRALLLRRTFPELNRSLISRALAKFPRDICRWVASEKSFYFKNGSILEFGYCERENDVYQYHSAEYGFIGFDELTHFTKMQWDYLVNSRLRSTVPGAWPRARAASNPGGVGHLWVKEMFIDKGAPDTVWEDEFGIKVAFIPAKAKDNPHLMKNDPLYIKRLQRLDEKWRRALLDGDWDVFAGQYFDMWDRDIHVIRGMSPRDIPKWWKRFRSLDYGLDMTACYWWAVAPDGRCIVYRELYKPNLNLSQAAEAILDYTPSDEKILYTVASPDLWNRRQDRGVPGVQIMAEAGLKGLVKADHRRIPGWLAMREYLQPYEDEHGKMTAKLVFLENCVNAIRTIPSLVHDDNDPDDVNEDGEDHAAEAIRYGVMSRPPRTVPMDELRARRAARERLIAPTVSAITGY